MQTSTKTTLVGGFMVLVLLCVPSAIGISVEQDLSLTLSQKNILDKFKEKITPLLNRDWMKNDIYLIRWLRARDFDPKSAEDMLRTHLEWRKKQKMDTILQEDWSDMVTDYHATMDTYDKQQRPVGVIDLNLWDIRSAALRGKSRRLLRYLNYLMENVTMQVFERQLKGMNVTQWKVLGNLDGFNLVEQGCPFCLPLWVQFIQSREANFPGWVDELILINTPASFNVVLDLLRPLMPTNSQEGLKVLGRNRNQWLPYLEERISKDQRRAPYGGTKLAI